MQGMGTDAFPCAAASLLRLVLSFPVIHPAHFLLFNAVMTFPYLFCLYSHLHLI